MIEQNYPSKIEGGETDGYKFALFLIIFASKSRYVIKPENPQLVATCTQLHFGTIN